MNENYVVIYTNTIHHYDLIVFNKSEQIRKINSTNFQLN